MRLEGQGGAGRRDCRRHGGGHAGSVLAACREVGGVGLSTAECRVSAWMGVALYVPLSGERMRAQQTRIRWSQQSTTEQFLG